MVTRGIRVGVALLVLGLFAAPSAQAKAPANDNFGSATPLAVGQEISGSSLDATAEANEPSPITSVKSPNCVTITDAPRCTSSVWFAFQAPQTGQYTVETCDLGTDMDTVLGVYSGSALTALTLVGFNDDACSGGPSGHYSSRVTFNATAGTMYHFDLNGFSADQGSYYIRLYAGPAQARPEPDTHILRWNSFAYASIGGTGAVTGPRNSASFALDSSSTGASFQCSLDKAPFRRCGRVLSYDLAPGFQHTFRARAIVNGVKDPTPAIERFVVDAKPPRTSLASGPRGDTNSQTAEWVSRGSERVNNGGFQCSLDGQRAEGCGSQFKVDQLCQGAHTFRSAANDPAANLDPTPLVARIRETAGPACTAPTIGATTSTMPLSTSAGISFPLDTKGAGGTLHVDYGKTSAYGMTMTDANLSPSTSGPWGMSFYVLSPNTTYHYRLTVKTPFGKASTGDQTFTTLPLVGTLPAVQLGKARVVGHHAARFPLTIDPAGTDTSYYLEFATKGSTIAGGPEVSTLQRISGSASGPQNAELDVVDLPPGATLRYRVVAYHSGGDENQVASAVKTLKVPAIRRFKLKRRHVSIGRLGRGSARLRVRLHGLPDATVVKLKLTAGAGKALKARKRGGSDGKASFKLKLKSGVRRALHDTSFGFARLRVTALPPGQKRSHITVRLQLGGKHKH